MTHTKEFGEEKRIDVLPTVALKLTPSTLKVYIYWLDTCRNDKPPLSNPKIAELLEISIPTVKRAHRELIAAKLLHREETSGQTSHTIAFTSPESHSAYFDQEDQYFDFEADPDPAIHEPGSKIARPTNNVVKDLTTTTRTSNDVLLRSSGNGAKTQTEQQLLFSLARQLTGIMTPGKDASKLHGKIAKTLTGNNLHPTAIAEMWKCVVNVTGEARLTIASATNIAQTVKELLIAVPVYTPQDVRVWSQAKLDDGWKPSMITVKSIRENISKSEPESPPSPPPPPNYVPPPRPTREESHAAMLETKAAFDAQQREKALARAEQFRKDHPEFAAEGDALIKAKRNELLQQQHKE